MRVSASFVIVWFVMLAGCGGSKSATNPTAPTPSGPKLTSPVADTPAADEQLNVLNPTLTVRNGTSDQAAGSRSYEFQVSDRSDFSSAGSASVSSYPVTFTRAGVPEGTGSTGVTVGLDLQPATRFFWRVRMAQGATLSDWSATRTFRTKIVGFIRLGELYDPLVNGESVAELRFKRTTFVPGKGLRIEDSDSYARYALPQTIQTGEFSMDVEGLSASPVSDNPDTAKLKIMSMTDRTSDINLSKWLMNVQYRGFNGNPANAISFKMVFGDDDDRYKLEPDLATRMASVRQLDPGRTYYWQATWSNSIRVVVQDGGVGAPSGKGGSTVYDYGQVLSVPATWNPVPHYAYLGTNNSGSETGSWPRATYRNVWLGVGSRPATLGSAMTPLQ